VGGDPQIITYDKELVLLTGTGQFTLTKDTLNTSNICNFDIEMNVADGQVTQNGDVFGMTTTRYLFIQILGVRIILNLNQQAMVGNELVSLPYMDVNQAYKIMAVDGKGTAGVRLHCPDCDLDVWFYGNGTAVINMCRENLSTGQTGLCGTCDGNGTAVNDLQTRDGVEIRYDDFGGNRKYTSDDMFQQISDSYRVNDINDDLDWNSTDGAGNPQPGQNDSGDNIGGGFEEDTGDIGGGELGGDISLGR